MRYSCGHVSTKKNVRGIKDAATSTPPQLRSSRYIRYRYNIGYPRYGERYDIGDNQYSSNNLSYCPINRFLESIMNLTLCSHVRSVGRGGGKTRRADLLGGGGVVGRRYVRLAVGQWALCAAELTFARAGGGENKKARICRDSMNLC